MLLFRRDITEYNKPLCKTEKISIMQSLLSLYNKIRYFLRIV